MPYIRQISDEEATGSVKKQFNDAYKRAGRVWNIVRIMSINAEAMRRSIGFYSAIMFEESPLTRAQREMLATVVSAELNCVY
jgi:alkylhydroperoxidase family enzyme